MRKKSYKRQIQAKAKDAFGKTSQSFDQVLKNTITIPRNWDGFENSRTVRANGDVVVGAFRNIFDLGNLYSSQTTQINNGTMYVSWSSSETPVLSVFFGHRTATGYVPGRDWIQAALEEFDVVGDFIGNFRV
jgi:hypothetical protein